MRDPPDAAQQYAADTSDVGDVRQHVPGEMRQRLGRQIGPQPELLKRNCRENQYRCAAGLMYAVNPRVIILRLFSNTLLRFRDQSRSFAELRRARGARFRAGRLPPGKLPLAAHIAFAHSRRGAGPFIHGNLKRTSGHAVAAAHAARFVVDYRPFPRFLQRRHRANRNTRWLFAMHADTAHESVAVLLDGGQLVRRNLLLGGNRFVVRQTPPLRAGLLARLATDTQSAVVQDAVSHGLQNSSSAIPSPPQAHRVRNSSLPSSLHAFVPSPAVRSSTGRPPSAAVAPAMAG